MAKFGAIIAGYDWSQRTFPTSPMPDPDHNLLNALKSAATGVPSSRASNTITRSAADVISPMTANLPDFQSINSEALSAFQAIEPTTIEKKKLYSRFTGIFLPMMVSKVKHVP